jgi:hypothetical protein
MGLSYHLHSVGIRGGKTMIRIKRTVTVHSYTISEKVFGLDFLTVLDGELKDREFAIFESSLFYYDDKGAIVITFLEETIAIMPWWKRETILASHQDTGSANLVEEKPEVFAMKNMIYIDGAAP